MSRHINQHRSSRRALSLIVTALIVGVAATAWADPDTQIEATNDIDLLTQALVGDSDGLTIDSVEYVGHPSAVGTFVDGPYDLSQGIVISSGEVEGMGFDPDENTFLSTDFETPGDSICDQLTDPATSQDAARLTVEFSISDDADGIRFDHAVGTEEYPDFVGQGFNDGFGIFINGENRALSVDDQAVTVNNFFTTDEVIEWPDNQMNFNGATPRFRSEAPLEPGSSGNTLDIVVCDAGDGIYDTGGFVTLFEVCSGECDGTSFGQCGDGELQPGLPCDMDQIADGFEDCPDGSEGAPLCNNDPANPNADGTCSFDEIPDGCDPINQCEDDDLNDCDENAICIDDGLSFICECEDGFSGDGVDCTRDVTIDVPADGLVTNDTQPTVSGEGEPDETVTISVGDDEVGSTTVGSDGQWSFDDWSEDLPEGPSTITAEAESSEDSVTIEIDTVAPPLSVDDVDSPTNDDQPTITGQTEPGAMVSVDTGTSTEMATVDADGNISFTPSPLDDGTYTFEFVATDEAGNSSDPESVTFEVDTEPPALSVDDVDSPTNHDQPTITGQTEPGATVTVDTGDGVETVTVDGDGSFSYTPPASLDDGTYTFEFVATDEAGNSSDPVPVTFEIDTEAPPLSVDDVDSPTNDDQPTITGETEPGAMVSVDTGTSTEMATVDADGTISFTPSPLDDGTYTFVFVATDEAGNSSDPESVTFEVDTEPPALSVDDVDSPTNNDQPTITGETEPGATVTVDTGDGTETVTADADGSFSFTPSPLDDGTYTFEFVATDEAGNTSDPESVTFEVDTDAPDLTVDSPTEGPTNDNRPEASGTSEPGATIEIDTGDGVETVEADEDGNWSWEPDEDLDDGEYIWEFTATDEAGNTSDPVTVDFEVDTEPPALTVDSPAEGPTNDNRPEASGTSEPGATIEIDTGDGTETVEADEDGNWSWEPEEDLDDGDYTWEITATDEAGNSSDPVTVDFEVDTEAPMVAIRVPEADAVLGDLVSTIEGDSEPEAAIEVTIFDDEGEELETVSTEADEDGEWTVELDEALGDGAYTAQAQATDAADNTAETTTDFVVDTTDQLVITSPGDGDRVRTGQPTLEGTAEPGEEVTIEIDGEPVDTVETDEDGNWSWTPEEPLDDGEVTIEVSTGSPSGDRRDEVTFDIDTSTTDVAIDSPEDGALINDNRPTISGSAEPGATVTIFVDDEEVGETTADGNGQWSFTPDEAIDDGDRFITAEADDDGIITEDIIDITIDTVPPSLVVERPEDEEVFMVGDAIVLEGRSDVEADVEVFLDGEPLGDVMVDDDGDFMMDLPDDLEEGSYDLRVTATDEAGNVAVDERTFFVELEPERSLSGGTACASTRGSGTGVLLLLVGMFLMAIRQRRD